MSFATQDFDGPLGCFRLIEHRPVGLGGVVDSLWYFEGQTRFQRERAMPNRIVQLIVHLGERYRLVEGVGPELCPTACIGGLYTRPIVIEAPNHPTRMLGLRLHPAGAFALLTRPVTEVSGLTVDLEDLLGHARSPTSRSRLAITTSPTSVPNSASFRASARASTSPPVATTAAPTWRKPREPADFFPRRPLGACVGCIPHRPDAGPQKEATMTLSPYLTVRGAARAIELYVNALGAREIYRLAEPSGKIGHAELEIAGQRLMLADEYPEIGVIGPQSRGGATSALHLDVPDVDALVARAAAAGFRVLREATDEFYGERAAKLEDPFGHVWHVATKIEDVSPEEMQRRWDAILAQASEGSGDR